MAEACLFCQIGRAEIEAHEVYRNERIVAFLDIGPIRPGHLQIIPRAHYPYFDDLPDDIAHEIMGLGQRLARVQKTVLGVERVAFVYTGGDIAHAHAHLVPLVEKDDITSRRYIKTAALTFEPRPNPGEQALADVAVRLSAGLAKCT